MSEIDLSVVMTIVDGSRALTRCLEALCTQVESPTLEVLVPYDDTIHEVADLAKRFPTVTFLNLGALHPGRERPNPFEQHALYDRRRAAGLRLARGRLVAILEDRGRPRPDWARSMLELHRKPYAAVGGAIENGAGGSLRWAVFFTDFGRYQAPLEIDDPEYLTDVNICYKREALESVRKLWEYRYQEPRVNWALRRNGQRLHLSDRPRVIQEREEIGVGALLKERFHWGRLFGQIRGRETSALRCLIWAVATPVLPTLLFLRHFRHQLSKHKNVREFILAMPAILLLLHAWILGEFAGYCEAAWAGSRATPSTAL